MDARPFISLFNGKTRVTFIHAITGDLIGVCKMTTEQLPASFNKPTRIEFEGNAWRVMRADPVHAKEFTIDNKLSLYVQENHFVDCGKMGFDVATISKDIPSLTSQSLFDNFLLNITGNEWRQLEFYPVSSFPLIQKEILEIESVLFPADNANTLDGYKTMHTRKKISPELVNIPFEEFCSLLNIVEKGAVRFGNGFVENGFAFRSVDHTYYGIIRDNVIEELCLEKFECLDEEIYELSSKYDLLLADWCNGKIIML